MWQLLYHWLSCLTESKSLFCSVCWALFSLAFLLLFVGWLNFRSVVSLLAWINWRKREINEIETETEISNGSRLSLLSTASLLNQDQPHRHAWTNRITLCLLLSSVGMALMTLVRAASPYPVYEYGENENIVVLSTEVNGDPFTWFMQKNDGDFKAPFCRDYDVTKLGGAPGYHVRQIRYEDRGTCWSIARVGLGIWWLRDPITHLAIKEN